MKDRLLDKVIRFDVLLGIVALTIALVAAFFSVYGIATLFAGAFASTAIMASVLEVGKLVSVTYLYRYWKKTKRWLAAYLSIALVILMMITSGGIFGYLSAAYQKSSTQYKAQQEQITLVEGNKVFAQNKIEQAQSRIKTLNDLRKAQEGRLSEALTNEFTSRNSIALQQLQNQTADMIKNTEADIKTEQGKIDAATQEIQDTGKKVNEMRYSEKNKDIRTFEFVAKLFNTSLDNVAKWFIFMLIFVFDPLAVALILAYNVACYKEAAPEPEPQAAPIIIQVPAPIPEPDPMPFVPEPHVSDQPPPQPNPEPMSTTHATPPDPNYEKIFKRE